METQYNSDAYDDVVISSKDPPMYAVYLLNDDYTTMDFVVAVLEDIFDMTPEAAESVMLEIHTKGRGIAGIYPYDIAETKARKTMKRARQEGFPLQCQVIKTGY